MGWLAALFGLVDPISKIAGKIADARIAAENAKTDRERIAQEERVRGLEARRSVLVAEAAQPFGKVNALIRAGLAFGPMAYSIKFFLWDKVIGSFLGYSRSGSIFDTDGIGDQSMVNLMIAVIAFYFLYDFGVRLIRK